MTLYFCFVSNLEILLNILDKKSANSIDASSVSKISWINEVGSIQGGFETPVSWWNFPIKNVRSCWKKQHLNAMCISSSLSRVSQNLQDKFLLLWWFLLKAAVLILSAWSPHLNFESARILFFEIGKSRYLSKPDSIFKLCRILMKILN